MRCICQEWIDNVAKGEKIQIRGIEITYCPFCGLELLKDDFTVFITYDGPEDGSKEDAIKIALALFDVRKSSGKKKLYFDIQLP